MARFGLNGQLIRKSVGDTIDADLLKGVPGRKVFVNAAVAGDVLTLTFLDESNAVDTMDVALGSAPEVYRLLADGTRPDITEAIWEAGALLIEPTGLYTAERHVISTTRPTGQWNRYQAADFYESYNQFGFPATAPTGSRGYTRYQHQFWLKNPAGIWIVSSAPPGHRYIGVKDDADDALNSTVESGDLAFFDGHVRIVSNFTAAGVTYAYEWENAVPAAYRLSEDDAADGTSDVFGEVSGRRLEQAIEAHPLGRHTWLTELRLDYREPESGLEPQFHVVLAGGGVRILEFSNLSDTDDSFIDSVPTGAVASLRGTLFTVTSSNVQPDGDRRLTGSFDDEPTLDDEQEYRLRFNVARPITWDDVGGKDDARPSSPQIEAGTDDEPRPWAVEDVVEAVTEHERFTEVYEDILEDLTRQQFPHPDDDWLIRQTYSAHDFFANDNETFLSLGWDADARLRALSGTGHVGRFGGTLQGRVYDGSHRLRAGLISGQHWLCVRDQSAGSVVFRAPVNGGSAEQLHSSGLFQYFSIFADPDSGGLIGTIYRDHADELDLIFFAYDSTQNGVNALAVEDTISVTRQTLIDALGSDYVALVDVHTENSLGHRSVVTGAILEGDRLYFILTDLRKVDGHVASVLIGFTLAGSIGSRTLTLLTENAVLELPIADNLRSGILPLDADELFLARDRAAFRLSPGDDDDGDGDISSDEVLFDNYPATVPVQVGVLSGAISATELIVRLVNAPTSTVETSGYLIVEDEIMAITSVSGFVIGVTRAHFSTDGTPHADATPVLYAEDDYAGRALRAYEWDYHSTLHQNRYTFGRPLDDDDEDKDLVVTWEYRVGGARWYAEETFAASLFRRMESLQRSGRGDADDLLEETYQAVEPRLNSDADGLGNSESSIWYFARRRWDTDDDTAGYGDTGDDGLILAISGPENYNVRRVYMRIALRPRAGSTVPSEQQSSGGRVLARRTVAGNIQIATNNLGFDLAAVPGGAIGIGHFVPEPFPITDVFDFVATVRVGGRAGYTMNMSREQILYVDDALETVGANWPYGGSGGNTWGNVSEIPCAMLYVNRGSGGVVKTMLKPQRQQINWTISGSETATALLFFFDVHSVDFTVIGVRLVAFTDHVIEVEGIHFHFWEDST